jgi:hypothetical protein
MAIFFQRGVERLALVEWQYWSIAAIPVNLTNLLNDIDPASDTIFNMPDIPTNARILFGPDQTNWYVILQNVLRTTSVSGNDMLMRVTANNITLSNPVANQTISGVVVAIYNQDDFDNTPLLFIMNQGTGLPYVTSAGVGVQIRFDSSPNGIITYRGTNAT